MASTVTDGTAAPVADRVTPRPVAWADAPAVPGLTDLPDTEERLPGELLADLDDPSLVLSNAYIGPDRRTEGRWAALRRVTFSPRRSALRLEAMMVAVALVVAVASWVMVGPDSSGHALAAADRATVPAKPTATGTPAAATPPAATPATPATTVPTTPAPVTAAPPAGAPSPTAAVTPPAAAASTAPLTPQEMGAQALALVRYPWQNIPGYTIQFQPISAAPSPGFYGNTTFTWGRTGGTSVLYVYPGETVERLAGITAFEIAHEVDAAAVQPQGGEVQIENVLGIHPASWAPDCDCAEQGFLSGWYAAAFSAYWSPGVGQWSALAPLPTGATLAAVEPWLNPTIP